MKTTNALSIVLTLLFGSVATATEFIEGEKKAIKVEESTITWKAYKVTGSHHGTVALKDGHLQFDGEQLTGGEFVVDMPTLVSNDLEGEYKGKLEGHLKSDDFFGTDNHPASTLIFTKVVATGKNSYEVTGDLTIKGKTNPVTFDISVYGSKAIATVKVDRTKYDIQFRSGSFFDRLGDKMIYDEFDLVVDLEF